MVALAIDVVLGDPPNRVHPLRWMGNLVAALDRRMPRIGIWPERMMGAASYALVALVTIVLALLLTALLRELLGMWAWALGTAVLFKISFAVFSFRKHCMPIREALERDDLHSARSMTRMIVSRDVENLGKEHVSSCCVETVAENSVDSVISPAFYMGLFGLAGAYAFRCANLMDAMWGYRNDRYAHLGTFPARLDDALGFITSRLSLAFITLAALLLRMDARAVFSTAVRDAHLTPSPNSGWPMAASAGALGLTMEKPAGYRIGDGPLPQKEDIARALRLVEATSLLFILLVALPSYVFIGAPAQLYMEDALLGIIGGLI